MRVLLVSNTYPPDLSGVASLVQEMARRLVAQGHEVVVLTRDNPERAAESFLETIPCGKGRFPFDAGFRYWRLSGRNPFDLIHVHESDGAFVVFAHRLQRWLRRMAGRAHLMATLQVSYDKEIEYSEKIEVDGETLSRPTSDEKKSRRRAWFHARLGRLMVRLADTVIAPSSRTASELEEDYGARDVEVVHNGIDVDQVRRTEASTADGRNGRVRILYAGRLRTRKAVAVLVLALRRLLDQELDVELRVVGGGEQFQPLLFFARDHLGDEYLSRARFPGPLDRDATLAEYAEADIYCLPSLYEGLPLAILEAMAASLPVVATDVSGNSEAVVDGLTGRLVEPLDVDGLAAALAELVRNPELRRAMGDAGRRRVEEKFTIEKIVEDHLRLCEDLVSDKTTRPETSQ